MAGRAELRSGKRNGLSPRPLAAARVDGEHQRRLRGFP